jgi:hypothetical protein
LTSSHTRDVELRKVFKAVISEQLANPTIVHVLDVPADICGVPLIPVVIVLYHNIMIDPENLDDIFGLQV